MEFRNLKLEIEKRKKRHHKDAKDRYNQKSREGEGCGQRVM